MIPSSSPPPELPLPPRVSVVIVSWNCAPNLRTCLQALEESKGRDRIEIHVVDANSQDGCGQMDAEFPGVTFLRLPRNFGRTRACNIAVRSAGAELILFLAPDVEVAPGTVLALADALDKDDSLGGAAPVLTDRDGTASPQTGMLPTRAELVAACRANRELPLAPAGAGHPERVRGEALMVRRSFLRGMNFLDEKRFSAHWAELDLCWQLRNAGKQIAVLSGAVAILHPERTSVAVSHSESALLASDRIACAASYMFKHSGFFAGLGFLAGQFFGALGAAVRNPGYGLKLAAGILSGQRIDGTQGGIFG